MSQLSDTPTTTDTTVPGHTHRDLQRAALSELVSLLTESATSESEIEARHATARQELEKLETRSQQDIERRNAAAREAIEQTYAAAVKEVDEKFAESMQALTSANEEARRKVK